MNLPLERRSSVNSFVEFHNRNFRYNFSKEIPTNCEKINFKELDGLQISIFGQICGFSQGGKVPQMSNDHPCKKYVALMSPITCYYLRSKC